MKKIAMILAGAMAVFGFSSCEDDHEPRLDKNPATIDFTVNTPVMADQYITLSTELGPTIDLTCSQPDYGFAVVTTYQVACSLSENFTWNAANPHEGEEEYAPQPGDYVEIKGAATQAQITMEQQYVTRAVCKLLGVKDEAELADLLANDEKYNQDNGYIPVYFKVYAYVEQMPEASGVWSKNAVCYRHVQPGFSLALPNYLYMVGNFNGWNSPQAKNCGGFDQPEGLLWPLRELESEIDSNIFRASWWLVGNDTNEFRFYQIPPAEGWGTTGSWGAKEEDFSSVDMKLDAGTATLPAISGGLGNFKLLTDAGGLDIPEGWYDVVVDLSAKVVTVEKVSEPSYYTEYTPAN